MKLLKRSSPGPRGLGIKARAYRQLQNRRAVFLSIMLVAVATALAFFCKPQAEQKLPRLSNWSETRAFSANYDPSELLKVFRASYTAHQLYVLRNEVAAPLAALDHAFDNVRSEAELRSALLQLIAVGKDKFAQMLDATTYDTVMAVQAGHKIGVGIEFAFDEEAEKPTLRFTINEDEILAGHGLEPKDIVLRINGESVDIVPEFDKGSEGPVAEMLTEYVNLGLIGSKVKLTVLRDDVEVEMQLTRTIVKKAEPFVVHNFGDPSTRQGLPAGRAIQFATLYGNDAPQKFAASLKSLTEGGVKGLIIDLGSVNGGDPEVALQIAAMLIEKGIIAHRVQVTENGDVQMLTWEAKNGQVVLHQKGPISVSKDGKIDLSTASESESILPGWQSGLWKSDVVLVTSAKTRGAPELIAAAMRPLEARGPVIGSTTAGKGMAQSHFSVGADTIIAVSTGFYLAPNGTSIENSGVKPTTEVDDARVRMTAQYLLARRLNLVPMPQYPETK